MNSDSLSAFNPVMEEEISLASAQVEAKKCPGPDGVPNKMLRLAIQQCTTAFLQVYNKCITSGTFPRIWKRQKLVLIPKPGRPLEDPSSFRPICLLDSAGKILEHVIARRLETEVLERGGISENQFGFRKGKSTVDAVSEVIRLAREATNGTRWLGGTKEYCVVLTLDIKNAFNTANWAKILDTLDSIGVSFYLRRLIRSYFHSRVLLYETEEGLERANITGGVPQRSVLGPLLWNIMYDGVLRIQLPEGTSIIGFADDIALVVTAKQLEDIRQKVALTVTMIKNWLQSFGLKLAEQKTEAILISSRKKLEEIALEIGDHTISTKPTIKYLGVVLDKRITFNAHLSYARQKAASTITGLSRIMLNTRGPKQRTRLLLASVVKNQMLYGAPIWAKATQCPAYFRGVNSTYRLCALRVCSAFRTVSDDAAFVVASMMPIDILAKESMNLASATRPLTQSA